MRLLEWFERAFIQTEGLIMFPLILLMLFFGLVGFFIYRVVELLVT